MSSEFNERSPEGSSQRSSALFERAQRSIPGGVNSPVRAFRAVGGTPVFIERAAGSKLTSADGREYVDFIGSWGPMILGHAHPAVIEAVREAALRGLSYGAPTELEVRFAEKIRELYPSIEMLRCVSSGTEATMSALRVARGHTKRDFIVKFEGCYHGHADHLLVKAGSGLASFGTPDSGGVPEAIAKTTLTLPFNDLDALSALFERRGSEIAAVIVEPVVGNMGTVAPRAGFLEGLIDLCTKHGAVSIFDEVMTGCRLARGGAQERFGLRPDLTTLGKIVGGGMPLAVYGGRADIMKNIAPLGSVYQAGTLSGNPIAVSAGLATLERLTPELYARLETLGARLEAGLREAAAGHAACVQRVGSMITLFFHAGPIHDWGDADRCDRKRFGAFFQGMLAHGIYWPPAQFEAAFISGAHSESDIDAAIDAARETLRALPA
jgi:glutamate-1-semialdehyde 2,1-aminomutase